MKPMMFSLAALVLYGVQGVILERRLSNISPAVNAGLFYLIALVVAIPVLLLWRTFGIKMVMPEGSQYGAIALYAFLSVGATMCFFGAFHTGGKLIVVMTIASMLMPVMVSLIDYIAGGACPTKTQLLGWAFAVVGVILVSK